MYFSLPVLSSATVVEMMDEDISIRQPNIELHICSPIDAESDEEGDDGKVSLSACMHVCIYHVCHTISVVELENAGSVSKDTIATTGQSFQECQPAANITHDDQQLNDPEGSDSDEDYPQDQYWRINRLEREEFLRHIRLSIITVQSCTCTLRTRLNCVVVCTL